MTFQRKFSEEIEMSGTYVAADGREITEEMIGRWVEAYERGEFPEGERTVGGVVHGRPPLSRGTDDELRLRCGD